MMIPPELLILLPALIGLVVLLAQYRRPTPTGVVIPRHAIVVDGSTLRRTSVCTTACLMTFLGSWGKREPLPNTANCGAAAGVLYLQHTYWLSDEAVVARWVENPYYQHFCGETFFQHRFPLDPSSLTRWRKRIGEEGVEWLLTKTIEAGREAGVISERSVEAVIVDTTVMEKAIAHPTDARLYERARCRLVVLAQEADLSLRQSYARLAPRL